MREKTGEGPNIQSWIPSLSPFRTCAGASMEGAEGWPWERGIKEENSGKKGQMACLSCGSKRGRIRAEESAGTPPFLHGYCSLVVI